MNTVQIKEVIEKADAALSVKAIAKYAGIDADSAELSRISDTCWEMVEQGELIAFDTRDQVKGGLFFDVKSGG